MIECFIICNYWRESCVLLILNCATIIKNSIFPDENELFRHF